MTSTRMIIPIQTSAGTRTVSVPHRVEVPAVVDFHHVKLLDQNGYIIGHFRSMLCAAFSAILRGKPGQKTGYSVRDAKTGVSWTSRECYEYYLDAITPPQQRGAMAVGK